MVKANILIVDDELGIIKFLRARLETAGYKVFTSMDGSEALQTFEREQPDFVILDINMPKMDGFEVCRRLREWSQVPIIMLAPAGMKLIKCSVSILAPMTISPSPLARTNF